jgi:selenocysteine-specific elongation factor
VARPGTLQGTLLCDAAYKHLEEAAEPLRHNVEVKLFVGAAEVMARTRILGTREIAPGGEGFLQLALTEPVALARGDRFILRRPSPGATIGGGQILDPYPGKKHRRFKSGVVEHLALLALGDPEDLLLQTLSRREPVTKPELAKLAGLPPKDAYELIQDLAVKGRLMEVDEWVITRDGWDRATRRVVHILAEFHQRFPLRQGMPREELRSRLAQPAPLFHGLIDSAVGNGTLKENGGPLSLQAHRVHYSEEQRQRIEALMNTLASEGVNSPSVREVRLSVGDDVYQSLLEDGRLVQLNADVVYGSDDYQRIREAVRDYLVIHDRINAAQLRDLLGTSRKYAIAVLEHLDHLRVTRRVGDDRFLTTTRLNQSG